MRVVTGRLCTPFLLLCVCGAAPRLALPCDHDEGKLPVVAVQIPTLPGYESGKVRHVSNRGDIVGLVARVSNEPTEQAVVWRSQRRHGYRIDELPPLSGLLRGDARGFATDDIPVGFSYAGASRRAVAWVTDPDTDQVAAIDLEPPPGFTDAQALAANGIGVIAGEASNPAELVNGLLLRHALVWKADRDGGFSFCDLGVPDGYATSTASDVSTEGAVVGTASVRGSDGRVVVDVFVWRPLGRQHPGGWQRSRPCEYEAVRLPSDPVLSGAQLPAINQRGDVVASLRSPSPVTGHAVYWQRRGRDYAAPEVLPVPEGFTDGVARAINASGEVVGTAQIKSRAGGPIVQSAVIIWKPRFRGWQSQLLTNPSEVTTITAEGINDNGEVVADSAAPPAGSTGAYVWPSVRRHGPHHGRCEDHGHHRGECDEPVRESGDRDE
jgi:uncharacterized membrane protein